ncbi:MAG TPA: L,D-transpeptidase [Anaerolineae bacterium]|nr:L,D-transpeptidase [Anaerolineae bacterium]
MTNKNHIISRREFIKQSLFGLGGLALLPYLNKSNTLLDEWPEAKYLARNTVYLPSSLPIRAKPTTDSTVIRNMQEDESLVWLREVVGAAPLGRYNRCWVETSEGYIYAPSVQRVRNVTNEPLLELPPAAEGRGMWAEVTVPYVNMQLENPPARAPWLNDVAPELWRLYYSQVAWIDDVRSDGEGNIFYRINERYGTYGDIFWAEAIAFRPITPEEIAPINPEVEDKHIIVNVNQQTLSCFEGENEVYFCRVSTGRKLDDFGMPADNWTTSPGTHWVWRKLISLHMSGGGTGAGWDTMAIPWTSLFVGEGVAIHATFWHNDFGNPRSHGCVNATPEDAKWIFRWTTPAVDYQSGDRTDTMYNGTRIEVIEPLY